MHFRHLLISGLMIGAALFLPDHAFAEKNELSGQQHSQKGSGLAEMDQSAKEKAVGVPEAVKPNVSVKEKAAAVPEAVKPNVSVKEKAEVVPEAAKLHGSAKEKAAAVSEAVKPAVSNKGKAVGVPNPGMKHQGGGKKQPSSSPNHPASQKPGAVLQNLPDQAKGNVKSALNKAEKNVKPHESNSGATVQETNNRLEKNTPVPENGSGSSSIDSLHNSETKMKNQFQSIRVAPQEGNSHVLTSKKENRAESLIPEPQEKHHIPSDKEELPKVSQVTKPTQRTSTHEGPSNDRLNTMHFLDKWITWNPYDEIQFVQPYLSRHQWLNNQWVNAPPSPPPQEAPLLESVTRS